MKRTTRALLRALSSVQLQISKEEQGGQGDFSFDRGGLLGDYLPDINNRRARSMVLQGREDI